MLTPRRHGIGTACTALAAAAVLGAAPAGDAASARPAVSAFALTPLTIRPPARARFRFLTSREGAASIALARIAGNGRSVPLGRLRFAVDAGQASRRFDGTVGGKALRPGRYRATVTVTGADGGTSVPRGLTFRVAADRRRGRGSAPATVPIA